MFLYLGHLVLLLAATRAAAGEAIPVVVRVITETAEVYECVHSGDPAAANYTWFRQDSSSLPKGIKAEGNRLHFLQATSHLNGLYGCIVMNDKGTFVASLYREHQDSILEKASPQVAYVIHVKDTTYYEEFQCVTEPEAENTKYSWRRQNWTELPQGVEVKGDRLHIRKSTPDLNGVYICEVVNQYGVAAGSLYRHKGNSDTRSEL